MWQTWVTYYKFQKQSLWFSNLNNHVNYIIVAPQNFSNFILVSRFIFVIFWSLVKRGEREELLDFD
jgi:hypothetical protein